MLFLSPYNSTTMRDIVEKAGNEVFGGFFWYQNLRLVTLQENLKCLEILHLKYERNFR